MADNTHIPSWAYKLAIVAATIIWGGSFTVMKDALEAISPGWLLAMRFAASAAVIVALFARRIHNALARDARGHLLAGVFIGLTYALAYLAQNVGLTDTTPGKNAFLTATYCVMVPFMHAAVARRSPAVRNVGAAICCLAGVGLVALGGAGSTEAVGANLAVTDMPIFDLAPTAFSLTFGDALTLVGAVLFAINIVQIGQLDDACDVIAVTVIQLAVCAVICLAWAFVAEAPPEASSLTSAFWAQMAYVVLLSTVFATLAQNVAQQHVPPAQAALLLSLESVFGALFSVLFYGEQVSVPLVAGFALIFASVVASELAPSR